MRSWVSLFKKEIKSMLFTILVSVLLVSAWEIYLITRMDVWPLGLTFGLGFIPFAIFPLIMLVMGYQSFRQEWKNNTIYLLKSLPRKGYEIVSAKLASSSLVYIVLTLYTFGLHMFFHWDQFQMLMGQVPEQVANTFSTRMVVLSIVTYILFGIVPYILSQFSYLVSCFYSKFRWLVSIVVFGLSHYLLIRLSGFVARLFNWLPDIPIDVMWSSPYGEEMATIYLGSGPVIAGLLLLAGFFFTGSWILEKQLDV
jgi:hypothetical protein